VRAGARQGPGIGALALLAALTFPHAAPAEEARGPECGSAAECRRVGLDAHAARAYRAAIAAFEAGCEGEDAESCLYLGSIFDAGVGVESDPDRARRLYARACEQGESKACFNLGVVFETGRKVGKDPARAVVFYRQAGSGSVSRGSRGFTGTGSPTA